MKNMLNRRVFTALVLALTASCASNRLDADGVVKARLGSLRRNDLVVVDVKGGAGGGLDTNAVREVVAEYDRTVIQPREGSGVDGSGVGTRLDRLEQVDDELALKTDRINERIDTNMTAMSRLTDRLVLYATNNFIAASNANARAWNLEKWKYDVGQVLGFWFDGMFLDTNTVFAVYAGDVGLRPRQAVSVMDDARVFLYGVGGYGGLEPTSGVRDLAAVIASLGSRIDTVYRHLLFTDGVVSLDGELSVGYDGRISFSDGSVVTSGSGGIEVSSFGVTWAFNDYAYNSVIRREDLENMGLIDSSSKPVKPLAGKYFNFGTEADRAKALKAVVEALGGTVTNFPASFGD